MKKRINDIIYQLAKYMEIAFSAIIILVIAFMIIPILSDLFQTRFLDLDVDYFSEFLSTALSLVVGIEFVKMLCKHTAETLLEVLLFATARQMVVEHLPTWQTLIGVFAIAILFAIRKYLLLSDSEKTSDKL